MSKKLNFILLFAIAGCILLIISRASSISSAIEPESATASGGATIINSSSASGGRAVKFSQGSTASWPGLNDYKVCGNTSILNGPTSAPSGSNVVTVNPGTDLATLSANSAAGTTFYLTSGTHTLSTAPINPKTGNTYIGAPGAVLDGQYSANYTRTRANNYVAHMSMAFKGSTGSPNVTIKNLTIKNFGQADGLSADMINQTAINWGQSPGWTIANNTISNNGGSGIYVATNSKLVNNCIENNEQLGFSIPSKGGTDYTQHTNVLIEGNEIRNNNRTGNIESVIDPAYTDGRKVCTGCSGGLKIWNTKGVTIRNNNVHNNNGSGIWVDNNNIDVLIEGNVSKDNSKRGIFYEISYSGIIRNNYVAGNYVSGKGGPNNSAIYISESGGDVATSNYLGSDQTKFPPELNIYNNYVVDNWHGIGLWERAGRYCTQNDTSWCPPLIQGQNDAENKANITKCSTDLANNAGICRWKTQNVKVHNNKFEMTSGATWCPPTNTGCANVAIFANTDAPAGTPYAGTVVQNNITKNQNNKFYSNTYIGSWNFYIPNTVVTRSAWQDSWGQDLGSIFQ